MKISVAIKWENLFRKVKTQKVFPYLEKVVSLNAGHHFSNIKKCRVTNLHIYFSSSIDIFLKWVFLSFSRFCFMKDDDLSEYWFLLFHSFFHVFFSRFSWDFIIIIIIISSDFFAFLFFFFYSFWPLRFITASLIFSTSFFCLGFLIPFFLFLFVLCFYGWIITNHC